MLADTLVSWGLIAALILFAVAYGLQLRAAFASDERAVHEAAAATIGQLLVVAWIGLGLATAVAVWHGLVLPAVCAAALFWLVTAAGARFSRSSRAWDERHAIHIG
ncbi:MAG TPA: hypothetical protein VNL77_18535 [Roseiflexaceae bacterium]|nr:hypothetical protein [Roseiflexaceae bacterium]